MCSDGSQQLLVVTLALLAIVDLWSSGRMELLLISLLR